MLFIDGDEYHHLIRVLRRQIDDEVIAISPHQGIRFLTRIEAINPNQAALRVIAELPKLDPPSGSTSVHLVIGLLQPKLLDLVAEKASELGVTALHIFCGQKSKLSELSSDRQARLIRLSEAAAKQSGIQQAPAIHCYESLVEALAALHGAPASTSSSPQSSQARLLCSISPPSGDSATGPIVPLPIVQLHQALLELRANYQALREISTGGDSPTPDITPLQHSPQNDETYLVVGPESGLTKAEEESAISWGYRPVSLGPTVLRAETAAIAASAIAIALLR